MKVCNDCPFRKKSVPGWLGPWENAWHIMQSVYHNYFPCHKTIKYDGITKGTIPCAGALIFCKNIMKLPRDPMMCGEVEKSDLIFQTEAEMMLHHKRKEP
jgi:hypothetical protein